MEFKINLSSLLKNQKVKSYGEKQDVNGELHECFIAKILPHMVKNYTATDALTTVIDKMGDASSLAQGLTGVITTSTSFRSSDYTLYLKVHGNKCLGLIKTGYKNLYVREFHNSSMINIKPL
mmetsp:Transcript_25787/g.29713  ORF Transcript_25787/g.29713 Transcript_25787/m.29713 type:complete len:122 (+) Transcript_25787:21-386(+)